MRHESNHRKVRLGFETIKDYKSVQDYRRRRAERLAERGIKIGEYRRSQGSVKVKKKDPLIGIYRADDDGDEENNNQGGGSGGSHGNTRLPFGLCKRFGIEISESWGPREAWDALAGKGITADGAYKRLKKGEDPGIPPEGGDDGSKPEEAEVPKEPKKTATIGGKEYDKLSLGYYSWSKYGAFTLRGTAEDGTQLYERYETKDDLLMALKEAGVEEVVDPEYGEILNPTEMEFPKVLFRETYPTTGYKAVSIGMRGGAYVVFGTKLDGKKKEIDGYRSLADAKEFLTKMGVADEDIKLTPALKKREKERTAWLTSDKKEYVELDGVRYGDLVGVYRGSGEYMLKMSDENGDKKGKTFRTKTDMIAYLKEEGVERAKIGDEFINPQEVDIPDSVAKIGRYRYQKLYFKEAYTDGPVCLYGTDLDGRERRITMPMTGEKFEDFESRIRSELEISDVNIEKDDEVKKALEKKAEEERERERRRAEFEAKAVYFGGRRYSDFKVEKYGDSYRLYGYDEDGDRIFLSSGKSVGDIATQLDKTVGVDRATMDDDVKKEYDKYLEFKKDFDSRAIEYGGEKYVDIELVPTDDEGYFGITGYNKRQVKCYLAFADDMVSTVERLEKMGLNPEEHIKDDKVREQYEKFKEYTEAFEKKAETFEGTKYADVGLMVSSWGEDVVLYGNDRRGRKRTITSGSLKDVDNFIKKETGKSIDDYEVDEDYKEAFKMMKKEEAAIDSGEYHRIDRHAYKDCYIEKAPSGYAYRVYGTDIDGKKSMLDRGLSYEDALEFFESKGIDDYYISDGSGGKISRPMDGMRKVRMMRTPDGTFKIMATTGKDKFGEVHSTSSEQEARQWLKDNGVDDSNIKTKGMNPNDDVPRVHTAKTLEKFDSHRAENEDKYPVLERMSAADKQDVVNMMTDLFENGQYRMWRRGHFEEIVLEGFKNTMETGTSGGASGESLRRYTEKEMLGIESHNISEGEKYGFLGHDDDREAFDSSIASHYGGSDGTLFKFKKDALVDRVTYTCGDSLDCSPEGMQDRPLAGYAGSKPTYEGISALRKKPLKEMRERYKEYKDGKLTYNEFLEAASKLCADRYIECHFHGKLGIEDVESISMSRDKLSYTFGTMSAENRKKVVTKLKQCGIILQIDDGHKFKDGYEILREEFGLE